MSIVIYFVLEKPPTPVNEVALYSVDAPKLQLLDSDTWPSLKVFQNDGYFKVHVILCYTSPCHSEELIEVKEQAL